MGLLKTAAKVAVATSVHGRVQRRQQSRWAAQDQAAAQAATPAPPLRSRLRPHSTRPRATTPMNCSPSSSSSVNSAMPVYSPTTNSRRRRRGSWPAKANGRGPRRLPWS